VRAGKALCGSHTLQLLVKPESVAMRWGAGDSSASFTQRADDRQVRVVIFATTDHMKDREGRSADRGEQRRKGLARIASARGVIFDATTPAGVFVGGAAVPRVHHDEGGVFRREFDIDRLPAAVSFRRHGARRIGVELLVELRAEPKRSSSTRLFRTRGPPEQATDDEEESARDTKLIMGEASGDEGSTTQASSTTPRSTLTVASIW